MTLADTANANNSTLFSHSPRALLRLTSKVDRRSGKGGKNGPRSQKMSPKLLRRMQSSVAYRVNVCMVIYPPRSQNLHPVWPTYRELWPRPCHTTARSLRETYKEIGALPSLGIPAGARGCWRCETSASLSRRAKIFRGSCNTRFPFVRVLRSEIKYNTNNGSSLPTKNIAVVFYRIYRRIPVSRRKHFWS